LRRRVSPETIWRRDTAQLGRLDTLSPFGLDFFDPSYHQQLIETGLASLRDIGWLLPDAVTAAETDEVRVSRLLRAMSTLIVVSMAAPV
jgi:hypothetical protein